ncbi:hypothetical protein P691DRAFT_533777 [Macrolepiota fuliginosa MF-IS2]|uniref:Uncharacterized protein n=1 Tax=Macrolepiota fuliginosa MF-IS2 TaxID=1400762 RepID=A0A9P6BXV9_9AGAR|nr:hypothetical protein P691DRAFT_533777 [Macrolepiota fuliginosa MF-IS2]
MQYPTMIRPTFGLPAPLKRYWKACCSQCLCLLRSLCRRSFVSGRALLRLSTSSDTGGGGDASVRPEEEWWLALGAFEVLVNPWPPANKCGTVHLVHQAITAPPPSQLRNRILCFVVLEA